MAVLVFVATACGGTTREQRSEYNEIKEVMESIEWPEDAGEVTGGGFPAGDNSSRPEYILGVNLKVGERPEPIMNEIVANLDRDAWMIISVNCDIPSIAIMRRDSGIKADFWIGAGGLLFTYLDTFPGLQPEIDAPVPACP